MKSCARLARPIRQSGNRHVLSKESQLKPFLYNTRKTICSNQIFEKKLNTVKTNMSLIMCSYEDIWQNLYATGEPYDETECCRIANRGRFTGKNLSLLWSKIRYVAIRTSGRLELWPHDGRHYSVVSVTNVDMLIVYIDINPLTELWYCIIVQ